MNVGVVCCKIHLVVSKKVVAQGRGTYTCGKAMYIPGFQIEFCYRLSTPVHCYKVFLNRLHIANHSVQKRDNSV